MNDVQDATYFDREYFELHPGKERYLAYLIEQLRKCGISSGPVLDVGSGFGFFLSALHAAGFEPQGLDRSTLAAEKSREL